MSLNVGNLNVKLNIDMSDFEENMKSVHNLLDVSNQKILSVGETLTASSNTIQNTFSNMWSAVNAEFAKISPAMVEFGVKSGQSFASGLRSTFSELRSVASQMASIVSGGMSSVSSSTNNTYSTQTNQTFSSTVNVKDSINSLAYTKEVDRLLQKQASLAAR